MTLTKTTILRALRAIIGLPLMAVGVALLVLHALLHAPSNILLVSALLLELVGVAAHYYKVKRQKED